MAINLVSTTFEIVDTHFIFLASFPLSGILGFNLTNTSADLSLVMMEQYAFDLDTV